MKHQAAWFLTFACLSAAPAYADALIQIPTADLAPGVKAEYRHRLEGNDEGWARLAIPAGQAYELSFRYYNQEDNESAIEGGGQFQLLPDGIVTPGVSVGIWDVTNSSQWGRRGFFVITKALEPGQLFVREPLERLQFTIGTGTGRLSGIFAGLRLDLPAGFSLVGEYDARRLNAGIWYSPTRPLILMGELQNGNPYFGVTLQSVF